LPELANRARPYCLTELTPAEVFQRLQECLPGARQEHGA